MKATNENEQRELQTVGDLVAGNYRTAAVFEKYGIDFCCGGKVTVAAACREKGIDQEQLFRDLHQAAAEQVERSRNYGAWELPFLADYIVNTHHGYLREETDGIAAYTRKIAEVHGAHHPEVIEIAKIFRKVAGELFEHLRQEEEVLFPAIRKIDAATKGGSAPDAGEIAELRRTIAELGHEHDEIGAAVHQIRALARDYAIPADVCTTYVLTYQKLKEFEDDLHMHVHLENNILFPKAAKL